MRPTISLLTVFILNACSHEQQTANTKSATDEPSSAETTSPSDLSISKSQKMSGGLSYSSNAGSMAINYNGVPTTVGGGYGVVMSCEGTDNPETNGESRSAVGHFLTQKGTVPACGKIPYRMSVSGKDSIEVSWNVGPLPRPAAIFSFSFDLDKAKFIDFEFGSQGRREGCGYPTESTWRDVFGSSRGRFYDLSSTCLIGDEYPVAVAKREFSPGVELKARGFLADISRIVTSVRIVNQAGQVVSPGAIGIAIQLAAYSHPGTNAVALEVLPLTKEGRIPAGYSIVIQERINAGPPSMRPSDLGPCGRLESGKRLARGQFVDSCNGLYRLSHQVDGNLALYRIGAATAVWSTKTFGKATSGLYMQADGNLVLYNGKMDYPLFHTSSYGNPGASLRVQDDGNLVVYSTDGKARWQSGTFQP